MRIVSTAGLAIAACFLAFSQSKPAAPAFEVASIKAAAPPTDGRLMIRMGGDPGRINYTNVSLRDIIRAAYKVKDLQIVGPEWLGGERFDVTAKLPEGATRDQVPAMLQVLLAERFKLALHKEPKVLPAYAMVVAKSGKLHAAEGESGFRMMMGPQGRHLSGKGTMQQLADSLSNSVDRPILDMTELKGVYELDLEWSGDDGGQLMKGMRGMGGPGGPGGEGGPRPEAHQDNADAPTLFTALQDKFGLKLEPRKAPVDILIIDHAEKVPTEN